MNKMKRILSALLAVIMLMGTMTVFLSTDVFAKTSSTVTIKAGSDPVENILTAAYPVKELKLATMTLVKSEKGHSIYVQPATGEVAIQDDATGQVLFSNPYDLNAEYNVATSETKKMLLSQVILNFTDNGTTKTMYSFTEAALRNQITVKSIKNGVRVEYVMGEQDTNYLVPRLIEKDRFDSLIGKVMQSNGLSDYYYNKTMAFYDLKDPNVQTGTLLTDMWKMYPITQKEYESETYSGYMAVYVLGSDTTARELRELEDRITTYAPKYTYEELEYDHELTNYTADDEAPPLFRLALEYIIEENGVTVSLPASGLRYDESAYTIKDITILPYMGAGISGVVSGSDGVEGKRSYTLLDGYTFLPDGSGTILRYEGLIGLNYSVSGNLYGTDFAYHDISRSHAEVMRWPVFGIVTDYDTNVYWEEVVLDATGNRRVDVKNQYVNEERGYVAVITEGESMAKLTSEHGGLKHSFNSVYATFSPLPTDTYEIADSISAAGGSSTWTVTSERKYTGNYSIRYIMLEGERAAKANKLGDYYQCNYMGMADAYRDYLYETGVLTRLNTTESDIPLYIESFGSITTTERIFSIPVEVDTPLTTFEDVKLMYNQLHNAKQCDACGKYFYSDEEVEAHAADCEGTAVAVGINNVDFRLTGFANGGMNATYPAKLKWVEALGGSKGYSDLVAFAKENNVGLYPDFDLLYIHETEIFDGITNRTDAVKTIDNRYSTKRVYDAATQSFQKDFSVLVSASSLNKFYGKLSSKLLGFYADGDMKAVSLSTIGTDLNSDFDDDDPYNREDTKFTIQQMLASADKDFSSIMTDGGNAYVLPYADVILNMATVSSQYIRANETIPFIGLVLHGSKQYAGDPINMEGDIASAVLMAIENGASPYFVLSYENTTLLKSDKDMSKYYSVAFEIWRDELMNVYNTLNDALGDLQNSFITDHKFVPAMRVATAAEIASGMDTTDEARFGTASGTVVLVTYENGTSFILNYNSFDINVVVNGKTYAVSSLDFVKIG